VIGSDLQRTADIRACKFFRRWQQRERANRIGKLAKSGGCPEFEQFTLL
jgi:hypothetical protein